MIGLGAICYLIYGQLGRFGAVQSTNLIAIWVAQVSQVKTADPAIAKAGRLFAPCAAMGQTGCIKSIALLSRLHHKTDRAAVAMRSWFTIDWCGHGIRSFIHPSTHPC